MIGGIITKLKQPENRVAKGSRKSSRPHKQTEKYQEYLNKFGKKFPRCEIKPIYKEVTKNDIAANNKDIDDLINGFTSMEINEGNMSGGGIAIPLGSSYLTAILKQLKEGEDVILSVYDQLYSVLEKGLELLEFLSGKNNCLEKFLKYLLGDNITKLIEYYLIGAIFMSSNPLELLNVLRSILNMIGATIIPIIGGTVSIITGKYVSAITSYYVKKGHIKGEDKIKELQKKLNEFVNMSDEEAVENIDNKAKEIHDLITEEMKPMPIMSEEEKEDFMKDVKRGLTKERKNLLEKVGDIKQPVENMDIPDDDKKAGGKRHRKTKKHHKKSQKKYRKKSHKRHHKKK